MNSCRTILLIDDDPKLLRALERHLEDEGYKIVTAVSAAEGMAVLKHHHVDAVICDHMMPGTSGTQFLANVRRDHPEVVRFMLTGNISKNDAWRVVNEIGVCRLFIKPCSPLELAISVRQATDTANGAAETTRDRSASPTSNHPTNS